MISSGVRPAARLSRITETITRVPRMQGRPWQIFGSVEMCSCPFIDFEQDTSPSRRAETDRCAVADGREHPEASTALELAKVASRAVLAPQVPESTMSEFVLGSLPKLVRFAESAARAASLWPFTFVVHAVRPGIELYRGG